MTPAYRAALRAEAARYLALFLITDASVYARMALYLWERAQLRDVS